MPEELSEPSIGRRQEALLLLGGLTMACVAISVFLTAKEYLYPINSGMGPLDNLTLLPLLLVPPLFVAVVVYFAAMFADWPAPRERHHVFLLGMLCGLTAVPLVQRWIPDLPAFWIGLVAVSAVALVTRARMGQRRRSRG